jgi:hypothetical protein
MGHGMIQHAACDIQPCYPVIVQVEDSRTVAIEDSGKADEAKNRKRNRRGKLRCELNDSEGILSDTRQGMA